MEGNIVTYKTRQEIVDIAVAGIVKQGELARSGGECRYRMSNGCKCAIGWNIPDNKYSPKMEMESLINLLPVANISPNDCAFSFKLQGIHDEAKDVADFLPSVRSLCNEYALTIPKEAMV